MEPFYELKSDIEHDRFLRMSVNPQVTLGINIHFVKDAWKWQYAVWDDKVSGRYEKVIVENERFILEREIKNVDVTNKFYAFIKQIKEHPSYRLKIMNLLSEEIRPIWNAL